MVGRKEVWLGIALATAGCTRPEPLESPTFQGGEDPASADFQGSTEQFADGFVFRNRKLQTMSPYTGHVTILDGNASKVSEESYTAGLLEGQSTRWWKETGNKKIQMTYKGGRLTGQKLEWYQDGTPKLDQNFTDGIPDGSERAWYPNGQEQYIHGYVKGKPHGVWSDWGEDGKLKRSLRYEHGQVAEILKN
jgi:antitoxin component YwqK of YwqJK toxin-antitoxin module